MIKIVNIGKGIFISNFQNLQIFTFRENLSFDNIKSYQKTGVYPFPRKYSFEKTTGAGQTDLPQDLFWIRKSCVVKYKTLKRELNSWNIQSIDTTESKRNLVDRNTFTIFLKMSQKASESIKAFCRMDNCAVSFLRFSIFKDYVKNHY